MLFENNPAIRNWLETQLPQPLHAYDHTVVVSTPWSTVMSIKVEGQVYYLKQTPLGLFIEPNILRYMDRHISRAPIPPVLGINNALCCFLMNACGDVSLRTQFDGVLNKPLLIQGLRSYIQLQRALETDVDELRKIAVPDWGTSRLPDLFPDLLKQEKFLMSEGLTRDEMNRLLQLIPKVKKLCQEIVQHAINDSLVNGDFNENNMILDHRTQQIALVDWGESVITHPFFSLAAFIRNKARRYHLAIDSDVMQAIKHASLFYWQDRECEQKLYRLYANVEKLLPIYTALSLMRLQEVTQQQSKAWQRWFISDALRELINGSMGIDHVE